MARSSLRALLEQSIDYAGLFPPAELALEPALDNHANYVRSNDAWMLSTFVLPAAKFDAAAGRFVGFDRTHPLRISALGSKNDGAADFKVKLAETIERIKALSEKHGERTLVCQLEMPLPKNTDRDLLAHLRSALRGLALQTFWETVPSEAEQTLALLSESNRRENGSVLGFKLRTGGVSADAFPSSSQIARALVAAARNNVPIKFTAGLHHPIRQFRAEVQTKMHGFLNVLGAGILAAEHQWDEKQTAAMLDDEDAGSFRFADDCFAWRDWKIPTGAIVARRRFVTSFGSCSFDEPRDDLRALNLL